MKSIYTSKLLIVLTILIAMPVMAGAQTRRKPRLRRAAPRPAVVVAPLVPIALGIGAVLWVVALWLCSRGAKRFTRDQLATRM